MKKTREKQIVKKYKRQKLKQLYLASGVTLLTTLGTVGLSAHADTTGANNAQTEKATSATVATTNANTTSNVQTLRSSSSSAAAQTSSEKAPQQAATTSSASSQATAAATSASVASASATASSETHATSTTAVSSQAVTSTTASQATTATSTASASSSATTNLTVNQASQSSSSANTATASKAAVKSVAAPKVLATTNQAAEPKTDYSYHGEIKNDVSASTGDKAHNATNVAGVANNSNATPSVTNASWTVQNFVNQIGSAAMQVSQEYGVYASLMMAQAGLESGWGQSTLATNAHNLFGVKYNGTGEYVLMPTLEYYGGAYHRVNAKFQKYNSYYDSLVRYAQLINRNYPNSTKQAGSYQAAAQNLRHGVYGTYATDPTYASKLISVINTYSFYRFDQPVSQEKYENGHWYLYKNGQKQTGFQHINNGNKVVYYNGAGQMQYGQQNINGHWYYFDEGTGAMLAGVKYIASQAKNVYYNSQGQMQYGEQNINGSWYLFDQWTGAMKYGWQKLGNRTVYYDNNGKMAHGQANVKGHWYYFDDIDGHELTSQFKRIANQNKTVYYNDQGQMLYGPQVINGKTYYFDYGTGKLRADVFYYNSATKGTQYYNEQGQVVYGQANIHGHWYLFDKTTGNMKTGFQYIPEQHKTVYYNGAGQMQYGQKLINNHWYLFDKITGAMKVGFQYIPEQKKMVYYDKNGHMLYGWQKLNGATYYFDPALGTMATGQKRLGGYWYNFENGKMSTGFTYLKDQNKTVYYDKNGHMLYGWQKLNDATYYFDTVTGEMAKGQKNINGHWYNFADGKMSTGFTYLKDQHKTVYYDKNGHMLYGWQKLNDATYYFDTVTGEMAKGQKNINGHWYNFADGKMSTGFTYLKDQNKTVYYDKNGHMLYGWQKLNGATYYFDTVTGEMAKGQKHLGKYWYNFDANGKMSIGFTDIKDQRKTVYYDKDGRMLYGNQTIAGKKYYFNPFTGALKK